MRAEIYWIPGSWPGRLGIVPRPRGGDWLEDEIRAWRDAGLDVAVSLLTPDEAAELGLECEEEQCGVKRNSRPRTAPGRVRARCVFRGKPTTDSEASRPPIPRQADQ
jgi:hypothetical protein